MYIRRYHEMFAQQKPCETLKTVQMVALPRGCPQEIFSGSILPILCISSIEIMN